MKHPLHPSHPHVIRAEVNQESYVFWSNTLGWVSLCDATTFTAAQISGMAMPMHETADVDIEPLPYFPNTPDDERPAPQLRAIFYDAHGNEVDSAQGDVNDVVYAAAQYMVLAGTDPDMEGRDAAAGTIKFAPVEPA